MAGDRGEDGDNAHIIVTKTGLNAPTFPYFVSFHLYITSTVLSSRMFSIYTDYQMVTVSIGGGLSTFSAYPLDLYLFFLYLCIEKPN